ncbi:HNH endonuclease [Streptomyces sp. CNZ748]|uniref:HNH endonuclease n=1 Tax=Streptomyces sp. CNZ748 TaxID=2885160 RepID=UPI001E3627D7|nr:HNH endonuclease [Streptomyces sp. CNZ748]
MLADRKTRTRYNRALRSKGTPAKACSRCFAVKALTQFSKHSKTADGRQSHCRDCINAQAAQWAAENRERKRAINAQWRAENVERKRAYDARWRADNSEYLARWKAENPEKVRAARHRRRAAKAGVETDSWTDADLFRRAELEDSYECHWCGADPGEDWNRDHIIPLSRGGSNRLENIAISCQPCNSEKWAKIPYEEWTPPLAQEGTA